MISRMPSIVSVDENNICDNVTENCPPYDVVLERDDILGIREIEEEELNPLTDDFISSVFLCNWFFLYECHFRHGNLEQPHGGLQLLLLY
jgi:hypothetical protein